jgi:hypothetical protein
LPSDWTVAEEVDDAGCALARVNVADHICIDVAGELQSTVFFLPSVVKSTAPCTRHVMQYALHGDDVLLVGLLHEPVEVSNSKHLA